MRGNVGGFFSFFFFCFFFSCQSWDGLQRKSEGTRDKGTRRGQQPGLRLEPAENRRGQGFPWPVRSPFPHGKPASLPGRAAWTYHHEELTSGLSQVKSRGSQSQIPPRGPFILTPLRPHQVRLRVRAPCVPRAEALSPGSARSPLPAPRRAPAPRSVCSEWRDSLIKFPRTSRGSDKGQPGRLAHSPIPPAPERSG